MQFAFQKPLISIPNYLVEISCNPQSDMYVTMHIRRSTIIIKVLSIPWYLYLLIHGVILSSEQENRNELKQLQEKESRNELKQLQETSIVNIWGKGTKFIAQVNTKQYKMISGAEGL